MIDFEKAIKTLEFYKITEELASLVWENLNADNKVSLFVRTVCLESGKANEIIINKNK